MKERHLAAGFHPRWDILDAMKRVACKLEHRRHLSMLLAVLMVVPAGAQQPSPVKPADTPMAPLPAVRSLKVLALAGQNEANDIERKVMAPLVIQVLDQNSRPVEGADVVFRFPVSGASAVFAGGQTSQKTTTNSDGQAAAVGWNANSQVGQFAVKVTATKGAEMGDLTVTMSNVTSLETFEAEKRKSQKKSIWSSKWVKIGIVAAAAGTAAGIVLANRGGSSTTSGPTVVGTPGTPTIGGIR